MASAATLLKEKAVGATRLRKEATDLFDLQPDPTLPLEGDAAVSFAEKDKALEQNLREQEMLRKQMEAEKAEKQIEFDGPEGRGDTKLREMALGDIMKSVGPHDHAQIVLPHFGAVPTRAGGAVFNQAMPMPTQFAMDGSGEPKRSAVMPATSAMLIKRGPGQEEKREIFNLATTVAGVSASFPTTVLPLMTEMFNAVAMMRVSQVISTPDENKMSFSVRQKLPSLTGNDVSTFTGVGGADDVNTNANAIIQAVLAGNGAAYVGEGAPIPEAIQTFRPVNLESRKLGWITPVTHELMRRVSGWTVESQLMMDAAELMDQVVGHLLMLGTGTATDHSTPQGLRIELVKSANDDRRETGVRADHTPTYPEMNAIQHSIVKSYAMSSSAAWLANWKSCGAIRVIRDDEGRPIYDTDPSGSFVGRVGGRPIIPDDSLPDLGDAVKAAIIFGDFSKYLIRIVEGLRIDYSFDDGFRTDTVSWRFLLDFDGRIAIPDAFAAFDCKDT